MLRRVDLSRLPKNTVAACLWACMGAGLFPAMIVWFRSYEYTPAEPGYYYFLLFPPFAAACVFITLMTQRFLDPPSDTGQPKTAPGSAFAALPAPAAESPAPRPLPAPSTHFGDSAPPLTKTELPKADKYGRKLPPPRLAGYEQRKR